MLHDEGCCFALFPISKEDEIKFSSDKMEMNLSIGATISKKKKNQLLHCLHLHLVVDS